MDEFETDLAKRIYSAIQHASTRSDRSQQASEFRAGVSDLGFCSERMRRFLDQQVPQETDALTAAIGTAIGAYAEEAIAKAWDTPVIRQADVTVVLKGDRREYELPGHPDIIIPDELLVLDGKTDYGLADAERSGANRQQRFQRHLYGLGAHAAGYFPDGTDLADVKVANFWIDRAGIDKYAIAQAEAFSWDVIWEATQWLDEVVDAYLLSVDDPTVEAQKEPPREMCAAVCGFYKVCREGDTDLEGLITDEVLVRNVSRYAEGRTMAAEGKRLMDQAKVHLKGVTGFTDRYMIRWSHRNESHIPATTRRAYEAIDLKEIKS